MTDPSMQPEKAPKGKDEVKGLDVTSMDSSFEFATNGDVGVTVAIEGTDPGPKNGSHLAGPIANRPALMAGDGPWVQNQVYTAQVTYLLNGTRVKWKYTVPGSALNGPGPFSFPNNSMTRQP